MNCPPHVFQYDNGMRFCIYCGIEDADHQYINISLSEEYYKSDTEKLLGNISNQMKLEILRLTDDIVQMNNFRGNKRRSILGVVYMYTGMKYNFFYTGDEICKIFKFDKKKFSFSLKVVMKRCPEYRTLIHKVNNFIEGTVKLFNMNIDNSITTEEIYALYNRKFLKSKQLLNCNPKNVCVCIFFKYFLSNKIKRSKFCKLAKISESSVRKILTLINESEQTTDL